MKFTPVSMILCGVAGLLAFFVGESLNFEIGKQLALLVLFLIIAISVSVLICFKKD